MIDIPLCSRHVLPHLVRSLAAGALGLGLLGTAPDARAASVWSDCVPVLTGTFANRVHVKCAASVSSGIVWFAVDGKNVAFANRFLSVVDTALIAGKTLTVNYDPADTSGTSFGCLAADCRRALGVNMR